MTYLYLFIPVIFTIITVVFSGKGLSLTIVYGLLFYSAPYLCWALIQLFAKPRLVVIHTGYLGATLSLLLIASFWFFPPDQSGLPVQWVAYWPLSLVLIVFLSGVAYFVSKVRHS